MGGEKKRRIPRVIVWGLVGVAIFGAFAVGVVVKPRRIIKGLVAVKKRVKSIVARATVSEKCVLGPGALTTCVASDMARLPSHGPVPHEAWLFDGEAVKLHAARNETVAFQVVLKGKGVSPAARVKLAVSDLLGPGGAKIRAATHAHRFLANYVWVEPGGYTWGAKSEVLPWPDFYPDALVPFGTRCLLKKDGSLGKSEAVMDSFKVPPRDGHNQAVWIDLHVPQDQKPGAYSGKVTVSTSGKTVDLPVKLKVYAATLPNETSIHAVGELYAPYARDGVGSDVREPAWQRMAHCYQQLAHRHRTVFIERMGEIKGLDELGEEPAPGAWGAYDKAFGPSLSGKLFTPARGYLSGPGAGVPVSAWRTPWVQAYNGRLKEPLARAELNSFTRLAKAFAAHALEQKWKSYFFAYIFDEVEGGTDVDSDQRRGEAKATDDEHYLKMAHEQMRYVQEALDNGAREVAKDLRIDLMWTSHANPARWAASPGIDLSGIIRLWVPNAAAADTTFLPKRSTGANEQIWFYHEGHPSVGIHAINASGVEMRTWGVIAARYGFTGTFMWAVNLGDHAEPYRKPSYKNSDDRFGNGTLVYPGKGLTTVGLPALSEPVPSMRLKMWRRGLQDAELAALAKKKGGTLAVKELLEEVVPRALSEGKGGAAWPSDSARWAAFHRKLLQLASE